MERPFNFREEPFEAYPELDEELETLDSELADLEEEEEIRGGQRRPVRPTGFRPRPGRSPRPPKRPPPRPRPLRPPVVVGRSIVREPAPCICPAHGTEFVRWAQDCLNQILGLQLPLNGVMGPETRSAVRSFQRQRGLRASGIVGPDTEGALKAACGGRSIGADDAGEYTEEAELGPLTATLRWIGPPDNPTLFTREEASRQSGGGVYIVVESRDGKAINQILKVGKTTSFRTRFGKDKDYRRPVGGVLAENLRFYLANIVGFVDPHTHIEKAIARLLFRSGEQLHGSRYVASTPVAGKIELKNILPKPFLDRLLRAYRASGKDIRGKPIPKGHAPYRIYPDALILEPASFPGWEVSQAG